MPRLVDRLGRFARSSRGKRLAQQAQRIARDPKTQRRIAEARARLGRR